VLLGLALGLGAFGWPSLIAPWFATGSQVIHRVHNLGYGALVGILLAVPLVAQGRRPEAKSAAMQQALAVSFAWLVAEVNALNVDPFVPSILVLVAVVTLMHPTRREVVRFEGRPSAPLVIVAVAATVPLTWFTLHAAALQRNGSPLDPHVRMHHWTTMAGLGLAIAVTALLASVRSRGWRIPAWCAGLASIVYGAASVVYPTYAGASGRGWGALAIASGVAFIVVAEIERAVRPLP
jgi:hypothetical protein